MRLQLTVQRQSLPPVRVLWTAGGFRPGLDNNASSMTVSQLLEQVNEVIPLEAVDWGLEDYVLEVRGFECLHFSGLSQVLKDDDEVTIRPLQTIDLRHRKISGRHQISADGRHLIDGVAFGRPFLRHVDRPSIRIPPRKRLRLTKDDEDGQEENDIPVPNVATGNHHITIRLASDHGDDGGLGNSEEDEDFIADDEDQESLGSELEDIMNEQQELREENGSEILKDVGKTPYLDEETAKAGRITRSQRRHQQKGLGLQGESMLALVDKNGRQYPGEYNNPLLEQYYEGEPAQPAKKRVKYSGVQTSQPNGIKQSVRRSTNLERTSRRSSGASMKNVRFQDDESRTPATVLETDDTEESNDRNFDPDEIAEDNSSESNKENVKPDEENVSDIDDSSSATSVTNVSDSSETSSSLASSSIVSSESGSRISFTENAILLRMCSKAKLDIQKPHENKSTAANQFHSAVPPGQGKRETQKRNQRRRDRKLLLRLKNMGVLPSNATKDDYIKYNGSCLESGQTMSTSLEGSTKKNAEFAAAFEAKRQSLLESVAEGGVEVASKDLTGDDLETVNGYNEDKIESLQLSIGEPNPLLSSKGVPHTSTTIENSAQAARCTESDFVASVYAPDLIANPEIATTTVSEPAQRRAKLDLASSRRMVFGSLGLRTPKNKADEGRLREKLMESVKLAPQIRDNTTEPIEAYLTSQTSDTDESWNNKIILKAVECCHDGIQLSTPPFPFVQRWDPQQQKGMTTGNGRSGTNRSKKRKRNNPQFHDQDWETYPNNTNSATRSWKQNYEEGHGEIEGQEQEESRTLSAEYQVAVDEQLMRDAHELSTNAASQSLVVNDLPNFPADLTICVSLDESIAVPGAIVSFKQLEMSQETQWQPQVSEYKTAVIDRVGENGRLEMTLAQRDRPKKEKYYDEQTGERLYSKFEAPDQDDESNEEDSGFLELSLEEMIEPKLIKAAESEQQQQPDEERHAATETVGLVDVLDTTKKSHDVGNDKHSDANETHELPMANPKKNLLDEEISEANQGTLHIYHEQEPAEITKEAREEITTMIKDAGFRLNVHSDIDRGIESHERSDIPHTRQQALPEGAHFSDSPKFNGFSSTPPAEQSSKMSLISLQTAAHSPSVHQQNSEMSDGGFSPWVSEDNFNKASTKHPKTDKSDHVASRERSIASISPIIPSHGALVRSTRGRNVQPRKELGTFDGANSDADDDFPTVEDIFSAASSRRAGAKESKPLGKNPRSRTSSQSHSWTFSQSQSESQQKEKEKSFSIAEVLASSNGEDSDYEVHIPPSASQALVGSQPPAGSQIVDLTLSSDAGDPDDSEYEDRIIERGLPAGPGWVQKGRRGGKSEVTPKRKKREKLRTRKTRSM